MADLHRTIAIDFDGCLFADKWPEIGEPNWDVINKAKREKEKGALLILNTCREGDRLDEALVACIEHGLHFDAINENVQERIDAWGDCRKPGADEYWDDRARQVHMGKLQKKGFSSPFENDPFALVHMAFENLFPGKVYKAYWEPEIRESESGDECYGLTDWQSDGTVYVFVKAGLKAFDAIEIFAHELAHVAVGIEHDHDEVWQKAFDDIFDEYIRLGKELFGGDEENE